MRRWLLILLVAFLPMQLSWAAVARYCQHESGGTTTQHVGHHAHQHDADASAEASDESANANATGAVDVDCGSCHAGCCMVLLPSLPLVTVNRPTETFSTPVLHIASQPAAPPERPNWTRLA